MAVTNHVGREYYRDAKAHPILRVSRHDVLPGRTFYNLVRRRARSAKVLVYPLRELCWRRPMAEMGHALPITDASAWSGVCQKAGPAAPALDRRCCAVSGRSLTTVDAESVRLEAGR